MDLFLKQDLFPLFKASAPASPSKDEGNEGISKNDDTMKEEPIEESEYDADCIIQSKKFKEDEEDPFRHKPRLKEKKGKLQELPMKHNGEVLASLCSIM